MRPYAGLSAALVGTALLREGLTWSDIRLQALRAVELAPRDDTPSDDPITSGHTS